MTPEQLKASILQYAIQGKLVEQRPEEGTGEELYQQIQKVSKPNKKVIPITESEIPFDIPSSWRWCKFGEIVDYSMGKTPPRAEPIWWKDDIYWVSIADMSEYARVVSTKEKVSFKAVKEKFAAISPQGTLIMSFKLTVGRTSILGIDAVHNEAIISIYPYMDNDDNLRNYLFYILPIVTQWGDSKNAIKGKTLNSKSIANLMIPLAPLNELHRIVVKIKELLPYVDRYTASYEKLEQFSAKFPEDMKKSILQYAIQGKLVEQRAEEGTGKELYQQIQTEKQHLIAEKKIKKEKPLAEISEDEIPFDIPENWKWIRVGEIFAHNTGKAMNSTAKKVDKPGSVKRFITTSNLYWNSFDFSSVKEMFFSDDELERCTVTKGDLLMCEGGAYYGRTAIWNYDYDICFQNHVHRLRPYKAVELRFFYHLFYFYKSMNMMNAKGTAMPGLSSQTLHQMVVPLPPLAEQKRIVEKLEELLPLCERLK
jgi:hypothetical protein